MVGPRPGTNGGKLFHQWRNTSPSSRRICAAWATANVRSRAMTNERWRLMFISSSQLWDTTNSDSLVMTGVGRSHTCPFSKLNRRGFIGGFARLAIACLHGHADQQSRPGRAKRTPNPHRAVAGGYRVAPPNCRAGAQPNSAPLPPSYRSAVLDLAVALVVAMARKPADRSARDRLTLAP